MTLRCCQLVRKGRFVVAEPFLEAGRYITLAHAKRHAGDVGNIAIVSAGGTIGRVIEVLGSPDNPAAVIRGVLAESGALGPAPTGGEQFGELPADVENQIDAISEDVPGLDAREDLRHIPCMTIDPVDAKDFDDAVGFVPAERDSTGLAGTLYIHVADVSAFVPTDSALDRYALDHAMSLYAPGEVAPMLPHQLSSNLCSLRPGRDRAAVTVQVEFGSEANIEGVRFHRSVIRSMRRLDYDMVDRMIEGESSDDPVVDEQVQLLTRLTSELRRQRFARGALDLGLPSVDVRTDGDGHLAASVERETPSHALVEECMLCANTLVGEVLAKHRLPAIFRVHDHPDPVAFDALINLFNALGVQVRSVPEAMIGSEAARFAAALSSDIAQFIAKRGRGASAFPPLILRSLQRASYSSTPRVHSGLAAESYVHFTSPIRRYPDIVNHRSLLAHIGASDDDASAVPVNEIADYVTSVEQDYAKVERRADSIAVSFLLWHRVYIEGTAPGHWDGEIIGVIPAGLFVRFGGIFEGFVPARTIGGDERYEMDEHATAQVGTRSRHRLRLGDQVSVQVERIDRARGKVDLSLR